MGQGRNVCLVGHSGSGKTTLVAALLKKNGITDEIKLDSSPEEKGRGYSIDMGFGSYSYKGSTFTLLDTPGGDEFIEEMYKAVPVADLNLLVVNGEEGVQVATERAWELTGAAGRATAVFINHLDKDGVDVVSVVSSMSEAFGGKFVLLHLPIREEGSLSGWVDLLDNRAVYASDKSKKDIPTDLKETAQGLRNSLVEEISTFDDALMMKFLEDEEITTSELSATLSKGLGEGAFVPVLCGSAEQMVGLESLMELLAECPASGGKEGAAECSAVVFNMTNDPYLGLLTHVRVLQGKLKESGTCYDLGTGRKVDIRDIYGLEGTKQKRISEAECGSIAALGKLEDLSLGTTLASQSDATPFSMLEFPTPIYSRSIVPESQSDVEKMSTALKELTQTKATMRVERDPVTKEMLLWGMGDVHLGVMIDRLKNRYNVSLKTQRPRIPYKETIRKQATAKYRHKKQTGGRGQFGEVYLRVEPLSRGEGFKFVNEIKGASIPGQYIPGVEKGVVEAMEEGNLAKYPVTDVTVAVYDGSHHPVDSSELAFKLAARNAFREAFDEAGPCLLEPVMHLEVRVPEDHTGDIVSDLNGRRGRILGMEPSNRSTLVRAEVPLAEVQSYALDLKSLTQGRASFQMRFIRYQQVPGNLQEQIVKTSTSE